MGGKSLVVTFMQSVYASTDRQHPSHSLSGALHHVTSRGDANGRTPPTPLPSDGLFPARSEISPPHSTTRQALRYPALRYLALWLTDANQVTSVG